MLVLDNHVNKRRDVNKFYREKFNDINGVKIHNEPSKDYFSNFWLTTVLIDESKAGFSVNDLRLAFEEHNIESRPLWKPMHLQPLYADTKSYLNGVSESFFKNGLCLPSGSNLNKSELSRIEFVIDKVAKNNIK